METGNWLLVSLPGEGRSLRMIKRKMAQTIKRARITTNWRGWVLMNFLSCLTDVLIFEVTNLEYLVKGDGFDFLEIFICDRRYYKFFVISFKF